MARGRKSELQRAFSEDGALKTHVGGQALIEGIMMRGKYNWAVAVREPNGGIYVEEHDFGETARKRWASWPIVRGVVAFVQSLVLGYKALEIAAMHAYDDEDESAEAVDPAEAPDDITSKGKTKGGDTSKDNAESDGGFGHTEMLISMVLGLVLGVTLFIVAPAFVTNLLVGEYDSHTLAWNLVDGALRVVVFVFYMWLIGLMGDIKRMYGYHGAEHKTIHCYEHGLPLTPENARSFPRLHVRCGTAFLIMVMIIAILVYTIIPVNLLISGLGVPDGAPKLILVIIVRIIFLPLIAGISYEITVKWAGSHPDNLLVKIILWPGMQMQRLTTNEPDDSMMECAIAAMQRVLEREKAEAAAAI